MEIVFKKQFVVFICGTTDKLDFLKDFAGTPVYRIARFDYESEAKEYVKAIAQEWKDYIIQECMMAITEH